MSTVIKVENISKQYRLGQVGTGSLAHDLNRGWHRLRRKEDPYLMIGEVNDRTVKGESKYVWALKDINFDVQQGEVLGIIGRNGAGKSTLLKILSRTTTPTTGNIKIKGRIASLLEVGTGFHPELSGRENIFLNGAIMGMTRHEIKKKFDEIVDFAGVERYIDTPVKRYSSGMYVRLAFGVAAHLEPEILIVDEVLAVGDAEFQKKALGKMKDVSGKDGRTVLFVSHNLGAINTLCNKILILDKGNITFAGKTNKGLEYYQAQQNVFENFEKLKSKMKGLCDDIFKLVDLQILQAGKEGVQLNTNDEIIVKYKIQILKQVSGLRIGFDLIQKKTDTIIFRTFHDDNDGEIEVFNKGIYEIELVLKPDFLIEGSHLISFEIGIHNVRWIFHEDYKIEINIYNIGGVNKNYTDIRPGIVMPKLNWTKRYISNE